MIQAGWVAAGTGADAGLAVAAPVDEAEFTREPGAPIAGATVLVDAVLGGSALDSRADLEGA